MNANQTFLSSSLIMLLKDGVIKKRMFYCVVLNGNTYIDCSSPNVIYLMTCNRCSLLFVGETVQELNKKLNCHGTGFEQPVKYGFSRIFVDHFHKAFCCNASYSVEILKKLEENGRISRNAWIGFA